MRQAEMGHLHGQAEAGRDTDGQGFDIRERVALQPGLVFAEAFHTLVWYSQYLAEAGDKPTEHCRSM